MVGAHAYRRKDDPVIYTLTSALASPSSEAAAKSTRMPAAHVVSIAPAAAPAANGTRPVAAGAFPCWLVQTEASGIEKCRMLVTSPAPFYLAKGTGKQWYLVAGAGVVLGSDAAWDVTIGDDPGDWLEQAPTVANGAVSGFTPQGIAQTKADSILGWAPEFAVPAGAKGALLFWDLAAAVIVGSCTAVLWAMMPGAVNWLCVAQTLQVANINPGFGYPLAYFGDAARGPFVPANATQGSNGQAALAIMPVRIKVDTFSGEVLNIGTSARMVAAFTG